MWLVIGSVLSFLEGLVTIVNNPVLLYCAPLCSVYEAPLPRLALIIPSLLAHLNNAVKPRNKVGLCESLASWKEGPLSHSRSEFCRLEFLLVSPS